MSSPTDHTLEQLMKMDISSRALQADLSTTGNTQWGHIRYSQSPSEMFNVYCPFKRQLIYQISVHLIDKFLSTGTTYPAIITVGSDTN